MAKIALICGISGQDGAYLARLLLGKGYQVHGSARDAQKQPVETLESISVGILNLLEAIRFLHLPIRLYNAGSGECFGNTGAEAADETTPFRLRSPYAVAKSTAFWEIANYREAYNLYACTGILFNHESPLRPERFVTRKIVKAACRIARGSQENCAWETSP